MKKDITVIFAENNNQQILIGCQAYEFEFTQSDLTKVIKNTYDSRELAEYSKLDPADNGDYEMAMCIASFWLHTDVELMIQDFIDRTPENLHDHLQPSKA